VAQHPSQKPSAIHALKLSRFAPFPSGQANQQFRGAKQRCAQRNRARTARSLQSVGGAPSGTKNCLLVRGNSRMKTTEQEGTQKRVEVAPAERLVVAAGKDVDEAWDTAGSTRGRQQATKNAL